jgi:hypothetical protein
MKNGFDRINIIGLKIMANSGGRTLPPCLEKMTDEATLMTDKSGKIGGYVSLSELLSGILSYIFFTLFFFFMTFMTKKRRERI